VSTRRGLLAGVVGFFSALKPQAKPSSDQIDDINEFARMYNSWAAAVTARFNRVGLNGIDAGEITLWQSVKKAFSSLKTKVENTYER
jgi:hypothetical protein